jgi:hypothetical protein
MAASTVTSSIVGVGLAVLISKLTYSSSIQEVTTIANSDCGGRAINAYTCSVDDERIAVADEAATSGIVGVSLAVLITDLAYSSGIQEVTLITVLTAGEY